MLKTKNIKLKRRVTVAGLAAIAIAALVPCASSFAWGPPRTTFTMKSPADYPTFNSITDNNAVGDERNFVRVGEADSKDPYRDEINVVPGKVYEVYIYYHNNAKSSLNASGKGIATGVRVLTGLNTWKINSATPAKVSAVISATNTNPLEVWDDAYFKTTSSKDVVLRYVEGSAKIHNSGKINGSTLSTDIFKDKGTYIGYNKLTGGVPGCAEFSGHITYRVRAEQVGAKVSKVVSKDGKNFQESVDAKPGDTLTYKVEFKNTGTANLTNVTFHDKLPAGVTLVPGTTVLTNNANPNGLKMKDIIGQNGFNTGLYGPNYGATITYKVKVNDDVVAKEKCGTRKSLKNTIYVDHDAGYIYDSSTISVAAKACEPEKKTPVVSATLTKVVSNDGKTYKSYVEAKPGATVYYKITFKNTGDKLSAVTIRDRLPSGATLVSGSITKDGKTIDDKLVTGTYTIGEVAAGKSVVFIYRAKLSEKIVDDQECGAKKSFRNTVLVTYSSKTTTAYTNVYVTKECPPEKKLNYSATLSKVVSKDGKEYGEEVDVKPGDTVYYKVTFKNTGTGDLTDVTLTDKLPKGLLINKSGTLRKDNGATVAVEMPGIIENAKTGEKESGELKINTGLYKSGSYAVLMYSAIVDEKAVANEECDVRKGFVNTVKAVYNKGELADDASVFTKKECEETTTPPPTDDGCDEDDLECICTEDPKDERCEKPPVTPPADETPELPKTGPGEIALAIVAVVCIATGGVYWYRSQKDLSKVQKDIK